MPQQIYCDQCTSRTFYAMLQDDGSITLFCATNNHSRTIVNIPELTEHMFKHFKETYGITENAVGREITICSGNEIDITTIQDSGGSPVKAEGKAALNDATLQHGAHDPVKHPSN